MESSESHTTGWAAAYFAAVMLDSASKLKTSQQYDLKVSLLRNAEDSVPEDIAPCHRILWPGFI